MLILVILANVAVYGVMAAMTGELQWGGRTLLRWGGNLGDLSLHGQPWRLVTATFLHASPQHIFGNMALLAIVGTALEARIGPVRSLVAYGVCGLAGSLLSAAGHSDTVSVGASGAIAGLLGIMVVLYLSGRSPEIRGTWLWGTVGISAAYSFAPDVDWLAHAGGFGAGLVAGGALLAVGVSRTG